MILKNKIIAALVLSGATFSYSQETIEFVDDNAAAEEINFIDEEGDDAVAEEPLNIADGEPAIEEPVTGLEAGEEENLADQGEVVEDAENLEEMAIDEQQIQIEDGSTEEIRVDEAEKLTDEEMISDYGVQTSEIAKEVTEGIKVEDIIQPYSEYHFSSFGKTDPFVPPVTLDKLEAQGEAVVEVELKSVLQKFPLLALKVAGVWQVGTIRKALVTTPANEGVVVQEGDPMGLRGGKVIGIEEDYVTVREFDLVADGTRQFEDIKVYLDGKRPKEAGKVIFKPGAEPIVIEAPKEQIEVAADVPVVGAGGENLPFEGGLAPDPEALPPVEAVPGEEPNLNVIAQ